MFFSVYEEQKAMANINILISQRSLLRVRAGVSNIGPVGRIRPAKSFNVTRETILNKLKSSDVIFVCTSWHIRDEHRLSNQPDRKLTTNPETGCFTGHFS